MTTDAQDHPPLSALLSLSGRVAVVTGAGRGIGAAIATRLAEAGADLFLADLDAGAAEETASGLRDRFGGRAVAVQLDVRDRDAVHDLAARADGTDERLRIWVNNAGIYPATPFTDISAQEWDLVHDVCVTGTLIGSQAAAARMLGHDRPGGHVILNMSSVAGLLGRPRMASYVAAKHAVSGLTRAMAVELGPAGIRVLAIAPSMVDTPGMQARRTGGDGADAAALAAVEAGLTANIPLGRVATADEIARVAVWAVGDLAAFVTGVVLPVDGGVSSH
ncbi:SDR family oxidoreductase [Nakamurella sp. YIM 132087]|uniref:SDR family oxidoreductase n=1 Tax=Nakamurella alba TaxID=2665158 RepID=A0A7K1FU16_9ACTN|nr:SDR family oxidoreductase [Nakamurella alba]MTD16324.1 SDR family oxidoreductase [Nakamurella alba]